MGNPIRDLRLSRNLSAPEMAETVKTIYPKFDRYLLSKCEASEVYGIEMVKGAKNVLYQRYAPEKLRKKDTRKCPHRMQCRLDDATYKAFMKKSREDGFLTTNDCLVFLIRRYLGESCRPQHSLKDLRFRRMCPDDLRQGEDNDT